MRLTVLLISMLLWSGAGPNRWSGSAFDWWRRSVRRSLLISAALVAGVIVLPLLSR